MNSYIPQIFEEKFSWEFQPSSVSAPDSEWIHNFSISSFGNAGELLSVSVDIKGATGVPNHGIERFSFWIANFDFSSLITAPRTNYLTDRGPSSGSVIFSSGEILVGSDSSLDPYRSVYNDIFKSPIPYVSSSLPQLAFTSSGVSSNTEITFIIKGRRIK